MRLGKVRGSVLGTLSLRCLPDTQLEMVSGCGCVSLGVRREVRAAEACESRRCGHGTEAVGLGAVRCSPGPGEAR